MPQFEFLLDKVIPKSHALPAVRGMLREALQTEAIPSNRMTLPPRPSSFKLIARMATTGERFEQAVAIMARLRGPGGCPWDREQTFDSIKPYTVEETYEVLEAIDNRDWKELPAELGDLLLQVLFYSQMASEESKFSIDDVLDRLSDKLISRHPHVFADVTAETSSDVLRNWNAIKEKERKENRLSSVASDEKDPSLLDRVSAAMPAMLEAHKLSSQASKVGFDWPDIRGLFEKLQEEIRELQDQLGQSVEKKNGRIEEEVGDLFFVLVNLARHLSLDPESALKKTNRKFRRRFQWMENQLRAEGKSPEQATIEELESRWQQAKESEPLT